MTLQKEISKLILFVQFEKKRNNKLNWEDDVLSKLGIKKPEYGGGIVINSLWHMMLPSKFKKVLSRNLDLSETVIFAKPKESVHVFSVLGTAGKTSLPTPNCISNWTNKTTHHKFITSKITTKLNMLCVSWFHSNEKIDSQWPFPSHTFSWKKQGKIRRHGYMGRLLGI